MNEKQYIKETAARNDNALETIDNLRQEIATLKYAIEDYCGYCYNAHCDTCPLNMERD